MAVVAHFCRTADLTCEIAFYLYQEGIRCSIYSENEKLIEWMYEDARTLHEAFKRGMRVSDNGPCLGTRPDGKSPYQWISYLEVYNRAHAFGSSLQSQLGLKPGSGTFLGIFAANGIPWVVAEQACNMFSMVTVPLYDTLGTDACSYIINQSTFECCILFINVDEKVVLHTFVAPVTFLSRYLFCKFNGPR